MRWHHPAVACTVFFFLELVQAFVPYETRSFCRSKAAAASSSITTIDPLVTRILLDHDDNDNEDAPHYRNIDLLQASQGIAVWRSALCKGRFPVPADFRGPQQQQQQEDVNHYWPTHVALQTALHKQMAALQLPRLVLRHPETCNAVLLCLLRVVMEFASRLERLHQDGAAALAEQDDDDDDLFALDQDESSTQSFTTTLNENVELSDEELTLLAEDVAAVIDNEFGGVVSGVQILDLLFGYNHGLVEGFGLQDGIWQHSAWRLIPDLQQQVASMKELRDLLHMLGRRPTVLESQGMMHQFQPRVVNPEGSMGAQLDVTARSSVTGLTLSNSLTEMLPSEAVLLTGSVSPVLRRLFWAKLIESKLLSYELSGWVDTPSVPRTSTSRRQRLPSAPGGPLVVCLDTSWSMSGKREWLSKAVVLASVAAAHRQRRPCHVVAFSQGVMDGGVITATPEGIQRLLEFLSHSFVGGTDVTGALKHAMSKILGRNDDDDDDDMAAADVLLITDGEIPAVADELLQDLDRLKRRTGLEVHGLLVGKSESAPPLDRLCTQTHDFLVDYELQSLISSSSPAGSSPTALAALPTNSVGTLRMMSRLGWSSRQRPCPRLAGVVLHARESTRKGNRGKRKFDDDENYYIEEDTSYWDDEDNTTVVNKDADEREQSSSAGSFGSLVAEAVECIRSAVLSDIEAQAWQAVDLDNEKNAKGSCWCYRDQFRKAVARINDNLVEREEESRLVVLGMAAGEHVLFLGPPGTAKSALGRRLANICGGMFFQRLLTRFTTPEELFGPLSLRALENDEYKRRTEGFLPKATVAFLDEIFKANSAILNTLLTILNERTFDNGAGNREECPIRCVIAASNELPESDELDALFDRFLLRKEVLPVSDDGILQLLSLPAPGASPCDSTATTSTPSECDVVFSDSLDKVVETLLVATESVKVGSGASFLLRDLRTFMREELDVDISDRRLVKAARLLKVSAASHGRTSVDPIDCLLLQHVAWRQPEQRSMIREWLWDHVTPGSIAGEGSAFSTATQFGLVLNSLRQEAVTAVRKTSGDVTGASGGRDTDIAVIKALREEALQIALQLQQQTSSLMRYIELLRRSEDHLWLDPDEARASRQLLIPRAETTLRECNSVLANAHSLAVALKDKPSMVSSNELRLTVIEQMWDDGEIDTEVSFTDDELNIGMKEAKAKYDAETFRTWKRARKKASKR